MAKTIGGVRDNGHSGLEDGDVIDLPDDIDLNDDKTWDDLADLLGSFKVGKIKNIESLKNMKDKALYKATMEAVSRFHSVMGVRERNIKLADFNERISGVQITKGGKSAAIYLNKAYFNRSKDDYIANAKASYSENWLTSTNKPVAHTTTHELAHSLWNSHLYGENQIAAGMEVAKLFNKWKNDNTKSGYGKYATSNKDEFWAETVTRAVHGKADKYTLEVKRIAKKYKL